MTKRRNPTLAQAGEDAAVEALTALLPAGADLLVGPGDDCAVLAGSKRGEALVFKTDCLIEGVHYAPDTPPRQVGWKAMARTLSDLAAMAAEPWQALVTLAIPGDRSLRDAMALYRGMAKAAAEFGCGICGGETANPGSGGGERTVISVAMLGRMRGVKPVLRSGGRPGDRLFVTGRLGGSFKSGRHLRFRPRLDQARWLAENAPPSAMMDLSDGLAMDLPRLANASRCGYRINAEKLPQHRGCSTGEALGDGEDYELLAAVPPRSAAGLAARWDTAFPDLPLTEIGSLDAPGVAEPPLSGGWDHYAARAADA